MAVEHLRDDGFYRPGWGLPLATIASVAVTYCRDTTLTICRTVQVSSHWGPIFAFILCLIITLGQNYEAFLKDTIDWGGVAATYIGIPLFLIIWFGYKLIKGTHFVRYSEMKFPQNDKK